MSNTHGWVHSRNAKCGLVLLHLSYAAAYYGNYWILPPRPRANILGTEFSLPRNKRSERSSTIRHECLCLRVSDVVWFWQDVWSTKRQIPKYWSYKQSQKRGGGQRSFDIFSSFDTIGFWFECNLLIPLNFMRKIQKKKQEKNLLILSDLFHGIFVWMHAPSSR